MVYIPCYFGVAGELSLVLQGGASTYVKDETTETGGSGSTGGDEGTEEIEYEGFTTTTHNLTETLKFDFEFYAMGRVQVYAGVGICGTLGVRGGLQVDANFTWYPTLHAYYKDTFDAVGFTLTVGFKMWVDLLVFTIPIPVYTLPTMNFGLNKQYEELKDKNEDELNTYIQNNEKQSSRMKKGKSLTYGKQGAQSSGITYQLKESGDPSKWSGKMKDISPDDVSTMATYKEKSTHTLLEDGYDRPDSQMIDMGENGTLLVFLQTDTSRPDKEQTALSYSVFKDGKYSEPVIIQTDGTADFQPAVTDAGDDILITWVSSDPEESKGSTTASDYSTKYVKSQEVYVTSIAKTDLAAHKEIKQDSITRLTDDDYYDSNPVPVYDKESGDINVYYIMTAEDTDAQNVEAADLANPMTTAKKIYSAIAYRVYDSDAENGAGKWVVDDYASKEKPDNTDEEAYKAQLRALGGQRILSSPIKADDVENEDPLIADIVATSYNGMVVFAYTIDMDNNVDTDEDRDLFIQLYRFSDRSTFMPVRITEDSQADSMPQLVRRGGEGDGTTYLFWKSGDTLSYIDVSSLVKYGIDANGQILESVKEKASKEIDEEKDTAAGETDDGKEYEGKKEEEIAKATYAFRIESVDAYTADVNQFSSYSQYKVAVDKDDNLYIIWVDNGDVNGTNASQEIYAAAMIDAETNTSNADLKEVKLWSAPNKLTSFGKYCDEPALAITKDNKMLMVYNKFDIVGEDDEAPRVADLELASSMLEPYGSMEATEITLSDTTPVDGEKVDVSVRFENTGLTTAVDGFKAVIYEKAADGTRKQLGTTYNYNSSVIATGVVNETFHTYFSKIGFQVLQRRYYY